MGVVIDAHSDTLLFINRGDYSFRDGSPESQVDLPKLRAGGGKGSPARQAMKRYRGIFTESMGISRSAPARNSAWTARFELNATPTPESTAALSPTKVPTSSATASGSSGTPMLAK